MSIERSIPEDFYNAPGWLETIIDFYGRKQKKLEPELLDLPVSILTASVGNVIYIYGNFTDDVIKLLEQTINPLFQPSEYYEKVYKTLKNGAVDENNPAIDKMAESLLFVRNLFDHDKKIIKEHFRLEVEKISGPEQYVMKEEKFASILAMITKTHILQVIKLIRATCLI